MIRGSGLFIGSFWFIQDFFSVSAEFSMTARTGRYDLLCECKHDRVMGWPVALVGDNVIQGLTEKQGEFKKAKRGIAFLKI